MCRLPILLASILLCASAAAADTYPSHSLRMIVPFPAGGVTDLVARTVAARAATVLGQPIVVENVPGASGIVGTDRAAKSKPDGYTLLMGNISTLAVNTATFAELPYDPVKSFAPVSMVALQPLLVAVNPKVPVHNMKELVDYAKSKPGRLTFGSAGSSIQLAAELFNSEAGIEMVHVPYKGSAPAITDLLGGQIDVLFDPISTLYPQVASGGARGLAVTTLKRAQIAANMPTVAEEGFPKYDVSSWQGIVVPIGTPAPVIERLHTVLDQVLNDPDVQKQLADRGVQAEPSTPQAFGAYVAAEIKRWQDVARRAGVKPN